MSSHCPRAEPFPSTLKSFKETDLLRPARYWMNRERETWEGERSQQRLPPPTLGQPKLFRGPLEREGDRGGATNERTLMKTECMRLVHIL